MPIPFAAINTVTDIGPIIIVIGVGAYLAISGSITVGTLAAFVGYLELLFGPLRRLVASFTTLTQSFASMDRVFQLIDEDYDIKMVLVLNLLKLNKVVLILIMLVFNITITKLNFKRY